MTTPVFAVAAPLDSAALAERFAIDGRIQIDGFLPEATAQALRRELAASAGWRHVVNGGAKVFETARGEYDALPAAHREAIDSAVLAAAAQGFQFRYDVIRVPDSAAERAARADLLATFASFMSAPETLRWVASVTGADDLRIADAQATRYRGGDFLTRHNDKAEGKSRRLAYVLGLTPGWKAEWGGLLHFQDESGANVSRTIVPRFNALSLFTVPQPHHVSYVAPYAPEPRISITGWLRTDPPMP
ncbi:MAG: 2OG-Fe(II) oxygenase [Sphingomonadaceae bacterium]|nr:2OG-Fe(II) oxygenase [Sphingomonadaceae bacterium]